MNKYDLISFLKIRKSIRKFTGDPVSEEQIQEILQAAITAPSAGNKQPWRIVIVRDKEQIRRLADAAYGQAVVANSDVVFGVCAVPEESADKYGERGRNLYCIQDTAALTYAILLSTYFMGLGGCWVGAFDDDAVVKVLNLPSMMKPVSLVPVGVPALDPSPRPRRSLSQITVEDSF